MRSRIPTRAKRWLFLVHRWLGVTTCLLCIMWFLTGLVMLYVPYPSWTDEERRANLPPVATERVRLLPDEALARAGVTAFPTTFRLEMFQKDPVYRIVTQDGRLSLSAATGERLGDVLPAEARLHLLETFPGLRPTFLGPVNYDQWVVSQRFDAHRPLLKFALGDPGDTVAYVSSSSGEIVQNATRSERVWNWVGAVPHWIYFTPIRKDQPAWRQIVMWLSAPLVIGAIAGLWIGVLRLRLRSRYARDRITPYLGWMKWHHLGGLIGGVFLAAWIASGWLSVNPFGMFARTQLTVDQQSAFAGWTEGMAYGVTRDALAAASAGASEISFRFVGGRPVIVTRGPGEPRLLDGATGAVAKLRDAVLIEAARQIRPGVPLESVRHLAAETVYWYSYRRKRPLPVLELRFADAAATWLFIDPTTGEIAGLSDRSARAYRWLFNLLHNYELPVLLRHQPARDALVWLLSIAGLVVAVSGTVLGGRVLMRRRSQSRVRRRSQSRAPAGRRPSPADPEARTAQRKARRGGRALK